MKEIPLGKPMIGEEELKKVAEVFQSPWILNGPVVRRFEEVFGSYVGSPFNATVTSCTAGMHLAFVALGIESGDEVILPAFNFVADGLSVLQAGAVPRFVDVDPHTGNIDPQTIRKAISEKTKALFILHYAGLPADMEQILAIANKYRLPVIEDASHALGSRYKGKKVGTLGDMTIFSFGPMKLITTGMGGMVSTPHQAMYQKICVLRSYGMDRSLWDRKDDQKPWEYGVGDLGHNFRMTDIAAAMGLAQMEKMETFIRRRREIAHFYARELGTIEGIILPPEPEGFYHTYLYYVVQIDEHRLGMSRDMLASRLKGAHLEVSVHWDPPLHLHKLYRRFGYQEGDFPHTEHLAKTVLTLPCYPGLSDEETERVVHAIKKVKGS